MNFKEFVGDKKPREKALKYGLKTLLDFELLAIILRTGTKEKNVLVLAQDIISKFGGLENFATINLASLTKIKGIGKSKALEVLSCLELATRIITLKQQQRLIKVINPQDVFNLLKNSLMVIKNEQFYLLLLNNQNKLIHQTLLYKGTHDTLKIDIKDILYLAINYHANKIICVHNHPSGDSEPSIADLKTTNELVKQLKIFDILLLDHIIIAYENYYSINLRKKYFANKSY